MWIESLRRHGKADIRKRVDELLASDQAVWCDIVRLELWNGARGSEEHRALRYLETVVRSLPIDGDVWHQSFELARKARAGGLTAPAPDLMIVACGQRHQVSVESCDSHFELLTRFR
ncbi:MAG TPA: PIN domain-containing protein [Tepidisphaeraceae bacterium]